MEDSTLSQESCVNFLNVAGTYVPNTKVECHYTLPDGMQGSNYDWIGLHKVGASTKDCATYVWAVSSGALENGSESHCSVVFQANYLPPPSEQQYHFRYVDSQGVEKGISEPFVFNISPPIDDLDMLEEEDMIMVVPKTTFMQQELEQIVQEKIELVKIKLALEKDVVSLQEKIDILEDDMETSNKENATLKQNYKSISRCEQQVRKDLDELKCKNREQQRLIEDLKNKLYMMNLKLHEKEKELDKLETRNVAMELEKINLEQHITEMTSEMESTQAKSEEIENLKSEKLDLESSLRDEIDQKQSLECEFKQEKDAYQVQLSESRRELKELKSALRFARKEKEQMKKERKDLMQYSKRMETRVDKLENEKSIRIKQDKQDFANECSSNSLQGLPDSYDESVENMKLPQQEDPYKKSDQLSSALPVFSQECQRVVISQPASIACQLHPLPEDSPDSW